MSEAALLGKSQPRESRGAQTKKWISKLEFNTPKNEINTIRFFLSIYLFFIFLNKISLNTKNSIVPSFLIPRLFSFPPSLPFLLPLLLSISKEKAFSQEWLKDHIRESDLHILSLVAGAKESRKESSLKDDGPAVFVTTFFTYKGKIMCDSKVFVNVRE